MRDDIATLTAKPSPVTAGGETHLVHPLTADDLGTAQAWVDEQFPDPFDLVQKQIESGNWSVAQQKFMLEHALEQAARGKRLIGTPDADAKLQSSEGTAFLIWLSVRKGEPAFTIEDARRFNGKIAAAALMKVKRVTGLDQVLSDPKAQPTSSTTSGTDGATESESLNGGENSITG